MKTTLLIALIHNNNITRLEKARPSINQLIQSLYRKFDIEYTELHYQPDRQQHSLITAFCREFYNNILAVEWANYRLLNDNKMMFWARTIKCFVTKYIFSPKLRRQWQKSSIIEQYVTAKHIRAWELFVQANFDYLLIFEDDVHFTSSSISEFNNCIVDLIENEDNNFIYIDLAGGCKSDELKIDKLLVSKTDYLNVYNKPVTNTACCYLIDSKLARYFVNEVAVKPLLRMIGVDWLMNKLFINLVKQHQSCACFHANPTIFEHGSVTGIYTPWQR